jgi:hypothetical protein
MQDCSQFRPEDPTIADVLKPLGPVDNEGAVPATTYRDSPGVVVSHLH